MKLTRRETLAYAAATAAIGFPASGQAAALTGAEAARDFAGDAEILDDGVTLSLPDIAEDGFRVLIKVDAPGASEILIVAPENPFPTVARFRFGPLSGQQLVKTRIRLARTQTVTALARMADGTVHRATRPVEVIVGGCGA